MKVRFIENFAGVHGSFNRGKEYMVADALGLEFTKHKVAVKIKESKQPDDQKNEQDSQTERE